MDLFNKLFKGRLNRKQYILHYFLAIILFVFFYMIGSVVVDLGKNSWILFILYFVFISYTTSLDFKRLHDLGYSGLFVFIKIVSYLVFTTYLGIIIGIMSGLLTIVLIFFPGQNKKNKYGAKPK